MDFDHRSANTSLQRARIDVMYIECKEAPDETSFVDNFLKYINLINLLQIENSLYKREAKDTYYELLEYCKSNTKYLKQSFSSFLFQLKNNNMYIPINYKWFEKIKKDEELVEIEDILKKLNI